MAAAIFQVESLQGLGLLTALALLGAWEARIAARRLLGLLIPVLPFAVLAVLPGLVTTLVLPATAPGPGAAAAAEPVIRALFPGLRVLVLVVGAGLASLALSPPELLSALARLLHPLSRWGVPVRELAWTALLAVRFLPLLHEETATVALARQARGAHLTRGGWRARARSLLALVVPAAARALGRADQLAWALEARGFRARDLPQRRLGPRNAAGALALLLLLTAVAWTAWRY